MTDDQPGGDQRAGTHRPAHPPRAGDAPYATPAGPRGAGEVHPVDPAHGDRDTGPADDDHAEGDEPRTRRGRPRRRPLAASTMWMVAFPVLLVAIGATGYMLFDAGTREVLDDTGSAEVDQTVDDPSDPGWRAVVVPTDTSMIMHTADDDVLVGVTVLVGDEDAADGGTYIVLPSNVAVIPPGEEQARTLVHLYETEGPETVERTVGATFGFGFTDDPVVMDDGELTAILELAAPLDIEVIDALHGEDRTLEPGPQQLDADELAFYFETVDEGEAAINRTRRQRQVLEAWFGALTAASEPTELLPGLEGGIAGFIGEMATGEVRDVAFPVTPFDTGDGPPIYVLGDADLEEIEAIATRLVPLPVSPYPGGRARIELRDGVGDVEARNEAIAPLVAAGAEIVAIVNESTFDADPSEVVYYDEAFAGIAEAMAEAIGAGTPLELGSDSDFVDAIVTLGPDWDPDA